MTYQRDTVVVGTSAGGLRALQTLLVQLPADFPAAVVVVQHQHRSAGELANILQRASRMPVKRVDESQEVRTAHVYVAPPDRHLFFQDGNLITFRGPRENCARPAINPLFRSAAAERGSRVIGVLLTGLLDDGVAGLDSIRQCGGLAVVQEPDDAEFPDMPRHALTAGVVDHTITLADMGGLLSNLVVQSAPAVRIPEDIIREAAFSGPGSTSARELECFGEQVSLACTECGGPLWQTGEGARAVYRCHVGHALTARALLENQSVQLEQSLWAAVRALTERASTLERLAAGVKNSRAVADFRERASEARLQAEQGRSFLISLKIDVPDEAALADEAVGG